MKVVSHFNDKGEKLDKVIEDLLKEFSKLSCHF